MSQALYRIIAPILFLLLLCPDLQAKDFVQDETSEQEEGEAIIDVMGQIVDHHYIKMAGGIKVYLPRIFFVGGDVYFFSDTQSVIESEEFELRGEEITRTDGEKISLDLSITSHLVYVWFGMLLTLLVSLWAARKYRNGIGSKTEPRGTGQNIFEVFFVFIRDDVAKEYIPGENNYKKFVNYLFSVFMAITFMNLFGLLPWGVSATADLTVTATLAAITFFITQFNGSKDHWRHVFVFPGVHPLMRVILTPIEILGLFTKPFALAIRLFANMLSGKIMIVCVLGLVFIFSEVFGPAIGAGSGIVWVALTALLYVLKAFIALLQAYIFTLLSAVFIGMAMEEHDHHEHESSVAATTDVHA